MKTIIAFFTSNIGLKILALILAIIVFYAVRDSLSTTRGHSDSPIFRKARSK
ncbi:MAG: hypothetical protein IJJ84_03755 [Kiritimatiellae bacterium]|nr:hypothetical protein [Kiritimatiellia bacterium]